MSHQISLHGLMLFIGDLVIFFAVLYVALFIRDPNATLLVNQSFWEHVPAFTAMFIVYEVVQYIGGFFSKQFIPTARRIFDRLMPVHIAALIVMTIIFYAWPNLGIAPKTNLLVFGVILFIVMYFWKLFGMRALSVNPTPTVLLGSEKELDRLLQDQPLWNINIVERIPNTTGYKEILAVLEKHDTRSVLVTVDRYPRIDILYQLIYRNYTVIDTMLLLEEIEERVNLEMIDELWFIRNARNQQNRWQAVVKRMFDLVLALPLTLAFIIVFPFVFCAIKFEDGGSIFYSAKRIGIGGREFSLFKFRSMSESTKGAGKDSKNQVTRVGEFLRKTSIDEFPQALSVLLGEQSFVGPRPEIPKLVEQYTRTIPHYNMRHLVRPGLTGWAQIKQKIAPHHTADTELTEQKLAYDLYYIKHNSVFLYIKIVLQTFGIILNRTNH